MVIKYIRPSDPNSLAHYLSTRSLSFAELKSFQPARAIAGIRDAGLRGISCAVEMDIARVNRPGPRSIPELRATGRHPSQRRPPPPGAAGSPPHTRWTTSIRSAVALWDWKKSERIKRGIGRSLCFTLPVLFFAFVGLKLFRRFRTTCWAVG